VVDAPKSSTPSARLARIGLKLLGGWKFEGPLPTESSSVILAGPHTSNLDGLLLVLITRSVGLRSSWMVKDTWTKAPIGWITKRVGAVGVNRREASGMVGQMAAQFASRDVFHLMIPPEGTRSRAEHWRSGFYHLALDADVPVSASCLDYRTKRGRIGAPYRLTGDKVVDMDHFRREYAEGAEMARYPDNFGPIRLRDEA
jgi:1-acyl-sn-glycerol-3-phosphate acyltransferase